MYQNAIIYNHIIGNHLITFEGLPILLKLILYPRTIRQTFITDIKVLHRKTSIIQIETNIQREMATI